MFTKYSQNSTNHGFQWSHDLPFASVVQQHYVLMKSDFNIIVHDGGSNPQSSDSKSDALSIGPHGLILACHCKYTIYVPKCFRNTVKTEGIMDSNGP